MSCSQPRASVRGIFQARILERVAISSFKNVRDLPDIWIKPASLASLALAGRFFTTELPEKPYWVNVGF